MQYDIGSLLFNVCNKTKQYVQIHMQKMVKTTVDYWICHCAPISNQYLSYRMLECDSIISLVELNQLQESIY